MMEVPNEPGLSPNNGLENAPLSDQSLASNPRKGQANAFQCDVDSQPDYLSDEWSVSTLELAFDNMGGSQATQCC
ncbi:MAG: hypothetical protein FRX49_05112, partial [Trebouxia sp. A1-2]